MHKSKSPRLRILKKAKPLRVGFLPVNDCAPLAVACELGLFEKYDLAVELRREASWKIINDQIIHRELDAAHAPASLPFLINLNLTGENCACLSGLVLSLQGNAITISHELWKRGVRDAQTLRDRILRDTNKRTYTFGVVFPFSSQHFLLCQWLRSARIGSQVRIVTVPPAQMFPLLKLGYLDGYCVGEPWTSVAVEAGVGVCVSTSAILAPLHAEKVLLVRRDFAQQRADQHERLIAALLEACDFCDQPENRPLLCELLSHPEYVDAPVDCLRAGLTGSVRPNESRIHPLGGLNIFHRHNANDPTVAKAAWIAHHLYAYFRWNRRPAGIDNVFRRDIFRRARRRVMVQNRISDVRDADLVAPALPARKAEAI
jgi:ABC-type nitrate/sulfonate/bicarbonate transport system substrate-binding protein